ncbi:MAG: Hsp20/alpha crystallin family protein [Gloeocapsa sp. DLM2.Bin57]|nr:MAG: Hsp20/alpha crystallin family protein [Gloeocapsa sp. DLM2.Bin57]
MTLVRWQPFREIDSLQKEMNRLFESLNYDPGQEKERLSFIPPAEMHETNEAIELKLEIPGMEAKDLDIQVTVDSVSISGERKSETKTEEKGITRSEFRYGHFRRIIPLPVNIDNNNVKADYKDGLLTLTLPKVEEEKNKVVKVSL